MAGAGKEQGVKPSGPHPAVAVTARDNVSSPVLGSVDGLHSGLERGSECPLGGEGF